MRIYFDLCLKPGTSRSFLLCSLGLIRSARTTKKIGHRYVKSSSANPYVFIFRYEYVFLIFAFCKLQEGAEIHWCDNGGFFVEVEGLPTAEEVDEYEDLPVPAKVASRIHFSTAPIKVQLSEPECRLPFVISFQTDF